MALNLRQKEHIERVQKAAALGQILSNLCREIVEAHAEEFSSGQDNEIDTADLESDYFITMTMLNSAVNQYCQNFDNFWSNVAVTTREYGKDARAVITHNMSNLFPIIGL